ncbi:MAG: dehydrogenase [Deltaproteobacteria bacterium]|nr:dehydrogenase [Deltaproteobacteria bacterium]
MGRLEGKTAIITGGAQGIGRAYCLRFAEEGANVACVDLRIEQANDVAKEINDSAATGRAIALEVDITSEQECASMAEEVEREFGSIDCLINNAALYYDQDIMDQSIDYLRKVLEINLVGQLICARSVLPAMKRQQSGSIINIASTAAYPLPLPPMPFETFSTNAYGLSKSGMIYMTKMMSRQAGQDGIRVNAIAPGVTMSEATKKVVPQFALDGLKAGSPLGSTLEPEDLTGTAVYLACEDSRLMTGQTLVVDAGVWLNG